MGTCLNGLHPQWKTRDANHACCANPTVLNRTEHFYKIHGMLTTHAILYVTNKYKLKNITYINHTTKPKEIDIKKYD